MPVDKSASEIEHADIIFDAPSFVEGCRYRTGVTFFQQQRMVRIEQVSEDEELNDVVVLSYAELRNLALKVAQ